MSIHGPVVAGVAEVVETRLIASQALPAIKQSYVICATPRSGSNVLCEILRSSGLAGRPDEYFWNPEFWREKWQVDDFDSYFSRLLHEGTTPNRVFGLKLMWHSVPELVPQLAALLRLADDHPAAVLAAAFPDVHYLWLTRMDKVRQGISWYRALATGRWRSSDIGNGASEPAFDFDAIDGLVQLATTEDRAWQRFYEAHNLQPLKVTYEDLTADASGTLRRIHDWLGIELATTLAALDAWHHRQQADALSDEWATQYRRTARRVQP